MGATGNTGRNADIGCPHAWTPGMNDGMYGIILLPIIGDAAGGGGIGGGIDTSLGSLLIFLFLFFWSAL